MTNQENKRPLSPSNNAEEAKPALRLDVFTIFLGTTLVALTLVPWYGFTSGYSTGMWVAFARVYVLERALNYSWLSPTLVSQNL